MRRRSSLSFLVVLLACAVAAGSEFRFTARVDLLPWMTVRTDASSAAQDGSPAVRVVSTQDRCLDVSVLVGSASAITDNGVDRPVEPHSSRSVTTAVETRRVRDGARDVLQITLN